jgi:hypothetical protein
LGFSAVTIDWDIVRYCEKLTQKQTGSNDQVEEALKKAYPSWLAKGQDIPVLDLPATMLDMHRNILLWYLPLALREERQVHIYLRNRDSNSETLILKIEEDLEKIAYPQPGP